MSADIMASLQHGRMCTNQHTCLRPLALFSTTDSDSFISTENQYVQQIKSILCTSTMIGVSIVFVLITLWGMLHCNFGKVFMWNLKSSHFPAPWTVMELPSFDSLTLKCFCFSLIC